MVLWGSVVTLLTSLAGLVTLGSIHIVGDLAGLAFVISLFILICATPELRGSLAYPCWRPALRR
jgi:hypothetical protein